MAVAAFHGLRTGHGGVLALLALSLALLAGPALLAASGDDEPVGFRFDMAGAHASRHAALHHSGEAQPAERGL
jgi:hypothetical protein